MKRERRLRYGWIITIALTVCSEMVMGQTRRSMDDPLFAIRYDPQKVQFEAMPASLIKSCPDLRDRYRGAWVYGHTKTPHAEYFIVSGLMRQFDQESGKATGDLYPDETGVIVALHGSTCSVKAQDTFYWINDSPVWNLSDTALNEFALDVLHRYARAYGGKKNFLAHVPKNYKQHLAPALRKQFEAFEH